MKILCSGDIHIGRRPSYAPVGGDGGQHSTAAAWQRIVAFAIEDGIDVVALTGDIVDRANRFAEAYGPLERGIVALSKAGIHTCAVAGNHDFDVFPKLAANLSGDLFHFLGANGTWERFTLTDDGRPILHVDGWSFPSQYVHESPVGSYLLSEDTGVPTLGMLHADLDASGSRYAPVTEAELGRCPVSAWLLGHVHTALMKSEPGSPTILYPGSPQALSRREGGVHGACLIELDGQGKVTPRQVPMASLQYDDVEINLEGVASEDEFKPRLIQAVQEHLENAGNDAPNLRHVVCTLVLKGRTSLHSRLKSLAEDNKEEWNIPAGDLTATVEKVTIETLPDRDLEAIANSGSNDPATFLAGLLLSQEKEDPGDEFRRQLTEEAMRAIADVDRSAIYLELEGSREAASEDRSELAARLLREEGMCLLETLLSQAEGTQ
jgi:DNA repair exonuclease SbcCD nuclease subunit